MIGIPGLLWKSVPLLSSFSSANSNLLPLVFLAIVLDVVIVGIWYVIGVVLHNNSVKKSAIGEMYQAFGTAVLAFIVIFVVLTFSSVFYSALDTTSLMNSSTLGGICTSLTTQSGLTLLGSGSGSILETSTNNGICNIVSDGSSSPSVTQMADYPLAASGVVLANLTDQTAQNLNSLFVFDAYLGFLEKLQPTMSWCIGPFTNCAIPLVPTPNIRFRVSFSANPFAGYKMIYLGANQMITLFSTAVEAFVAQLSLTEVFLFAWPWLLFGGLLLRATFFTRKIGGLMIAVALGAIIIYPAVFSLEYLAMGNGLSTGYNSTYGFNSITSLPGQNNGNYALNFFVQPNMASVLNDNGNGCYVSGSAPISTLEGADISYLLIPFSSVFSGIVGSFGSFISSVPSFYLPYPGLSSCSPSEASALVFRVTEAYGIAGVTAYFLPIINIIITLSAIIGLSGLIGGDVSLAGLSRLI